MATAIKCHTPGVVIVSRETFLASLVSGFATMASLIAAPRPTDDDDEVFPYAFDITYEYGKKGATAWISNTGYPTTVSVEVEIQFAVDNGDGGVMTTKVFVDLDFHGDVLKRQEFETTWDEDNEPVDA